MPIYLVAEYVRGRYWHCVLLAFVNGEPKVQFNTHHRGREGYHRSRGDVRTADTWHSSPWHGSFRGYPGWSESYICIDAHWNGNERKRKSLWFRTRHMYFKFINVKQLLSAADTAQG